MIIYSKKNILKWSFWRNKSKLTFCLASGLFYTALMFVGNIIFRLVFSLGESMLDQSVFEVSFYIAIGMFLPATFLSIALWYENERRFKEWELDNRE